MLGAGELDALAAAFERQAVMLEETGARLHGVAETTRWQCDRATRFRDGIQDLRRDLCGEASALRSLAARARSIADAIRAMERRFASFVTAGLTVDDFGNVMDDAGKVVDRLVPW